eukprot:s28_g12.t1
MKEVTNCLISYQLFPLECDRPRLFSLSMPFCARARLPQESRCPWTHFGRRKLNAIVSEGADATDSLVNWLIEVEVFEAVPKDVFAKAAPQWRQVGMQEDPLD